MVYIILTEFMIERGGVVAYDAKHWNSSTRGVHAESRRPDFASVRLWQVFSSAPDKAEDHAHESLWD